MFLYDNHTVIVVSIDGGTPSHHPFEQDFPLWTLHFQEIPLWKPPNHSRPRVTPGSASASWNLTDLSLAPGLVVKVRMIRNPIYGKKKYVPNHQPEETMDFVTSQKEGFAEFAVDFPSKSWRVGGEDNRRIGEWESSLRESTTISGFWNVLGVIHKFWLVPP